MRALLFLAAFLLASTASAQCPTCAKAVRHSVLVRPVVVKTKVVIEAATPSPGFLRTRLWRPFWRFRTR